MTVTVSFWLFLVLLCLVLFFTLILLSGLDQGHRGYVVANTKVVPLLAPILKRHSNINELLTCTTEPVFQVMMSGGLVFTVPSKDIVITNIEPAKVIASLERKLQQGESLTVSELVTKTGYLPNFCSFLSKNPRVAIEETYKALKDAGFSVHILTGFMPGAEDKIALLASDAFVGWVLVFRRHLLAMPIPNDPRLITKKEHFLCLPKIMRTDSNLRSRFKGK